MGGTSITVFFFFFFLHVSAVHIAAWRGNVDIVRFLLSMKAAVSKKDKEGATPFHRACGTPCPMPKPLHLSLSLSLSSFSA